MEQERSLSSDNCRRVFQICYEKYRCGNNWLSVHILLLIKTWVCARGTWGVERKLIAGCWPAARRILPRQSGRILTLGLVGIRPSLSHRKRERGYDPAEGGVPYMYVLSRSSSSRQTHLAEMRPACRRAGRPQAPASLAGSSSQEVMKSEMITRAPIFTSKVFQLLASSIVCISIERRTYVVVQ